MPVSRGSILGADVQKVFANALRTDAKRLQPTDDRRCCVLEIEPQDSVTCFELLGSRD